MNLIKGQLYQYINKEYTTCYYSDKKLYSISPIRLKRNDIFLLFNFKECLNPKYYIFNILFGKDNCFFYQVNNEFTVTFFKLLS